MKLCMFSVRDVVAGCYLAPFPARSEVDAKRQIAASFKDPQFQQTPVFQNPQDFRLMHLADFDDESGEITPVLPRLVAEMSEFASLGTVRS